MNWWDIIAAVIVSVLVTWLLLIIVLWRAAPREQRLHDYLRLLPDVLRLLQALARDRAIPRRIRLRLWLALAYLAVPVDLVPDFIPLIGHADDVIVVMVVLRSVGRAAGDDALTRNWRGSPAALDALRSLLR